MEMGLLTEEIRSAFAAGIEAGKVTDFDMQKLLRATIREFPSVFGGDGTDFVDIVRLLGSGKKERFRELLSAVKCSTKNTQYAQWLLSIRSFGLISLVSAVVTFYRRAADAGLGTSSMLDTAGAKSCSTAKKQNSINGRPQTAAAARTDDENIESAFKAAKMGFADVLYYMLSRRLIDLGVQDGLGRTLLFVAIAHEQEDVVELLLENAQQFNVDTPAYSGNTALHAAAAAGNADFVRHLLNAGANPEIVNPTSGATAAMIAEMHGHTEVLAVFNENKK